MPLVPLHNTSTRPPDGGLAARLILRGQMPRKSCLLDWLGGWLWGYGLEQGESDMPRRHVG